MDESVCLLVWFDNEQNDTVEQNSVSLWHLLVDCLGLQDKRLFRHTTLRTHTILIMDAYHLGSRLLFGSY